MIQEEYCRSKKRLLPTVLIIVLLASLSSAPAGYLRYKSAGGALQNVNLDVTHTITPVVSWPTVYIYKNHMRVGYQGAYGGSTSAAVYVYQIKVSRTDANAGLPLLAVVVGIRRDNTSKSPAEQFAYPNSTIVLLGPSSSATITLWWYEDGSLSTGTLPSSKTGVSWQIGARGDVAQSNAVDTNLTNNYQKDGAPVVAYSGLVGDVTGDGIIDILDAIQFSAHYGASEGQTRWDADMNLNPVPDPYTGKQTIDIFDFISFAGTFNKHLQP